MRKLTFLIFLTSCFSLNGQQFDASYRANLFYYNLSSQSNTLIDIDGDGASDHFGTTEKRLKYAMNDGTGAFLEGAVIKEPISHAYLVVDDLDGDGDLDVVTYGQGVEVYENLGDLVFADPVAYTDSFNIRELKLSDHDMDGDLDIFFVDYNSDQRSVTLLENINGLQFGNFLTLYTHDFSKLYFDLMDFEGDGDPDLMIHRRFSSGNRFYYLLENDAGIFSDTLISLRPSSGEYRIADLDGDGDVDLLELGPEAIDIRENIGDFNWEFTSAYYGWYCDCQNENDDYVEFYDHQIELAHIVDVENDGDIDIVLATKAINCQDYYSQPFLCEDPWDDFSAGERKLILMRNNGMNQFTNSNLLYHWSGGYYNGFEYMNSDDLLDFVSGSAYYPGNLSASYSLQTAIALQGQIPDLSSFSPADMDGDGDIDVLCATERGMVWMENESGRIEFKSHDLGGGNLYDARTIDYDGDGDEDVMYSQSTSIYLMERTGPNSFDIESQELIDIEGAAQTIKAVDMDSDGDEDILVTSNNAESIYWLENEGTPDFPTLHVVSDVPYAKYDMQVADFDTDGDMDVFSIRGSSNNSHHGIDILLFENLGEGEFAPALFLTDQIDQDYDDLYLMDSDLDGDLDLFCTRWESQEGSILQFMNLGGLQFADPVFVYNYTSTGGYSAPPIYFMDADADGIEDILSDDLIFYGLGDGTFELPVPYSHPDETHPSVYRTLDADLDGDGDHELISYNGGLRIRNNRTIEEACEPFLTAPVDLAKSFNPVNGVQDRVRLKWYKDSPKVKYSDEDAAMCDIKAWAVRNLDPETGQVVGPVIQNPDTIFLYDRKKTYADNSPRSIYKWPLYFRADGADNTNRVEPNTRYRFTVRCECGFSGDGLESPWAEEKFFNTPDFDPSTGTNPEIVDEAIKSMSSLDGSTNITISPNPASTHLEISISGDAVFEQYQITDLSGRILVQGNLRTKRADRHRVDLIALVSGAYHLTLLGPQNRVVKQFIVDR